MGYNIIGEKQLNNHKALNTLGEKVFEREEKGTNPKSNSTTRRIFPFTNENLDEVFYGKRLKGKRIATVGSSFDQALQAILHGCKDITHLDANPLSQPYAELKLSAIKNLTFDEFVDFFDADNMLDHKYYQKISHDLSEYSRMFWDEIYLELHNSNREEIKKHLFQTLTYGEGFENYRDFLSYCTDKHIYNNLKKSLDDVNITFKVCSFLDFNKELDGNYHLIMLSNIYDYLSDELFFEGVNSVKENHLAKGGEIQVYYDFNEQYPTQQRYQKFRDYLNVKKLKLQSVHDIRFASFFRVNPHLDRRHSAVVYVKDM